MIGNGRAGVRATLLAVLIGGLVASGCGAAGHHDAALPPANPAPVAAATSGPSAAPAVAPRATVVAHAPKRKPNPCARNARARYVLVSIRKQHLWMCAKSRIAKDTAVTTGMTGADTATPTGTFQIQGRNRDSVLTLNTGQTYQVKYWIPFQAPLFGFHDASWQNFPYGSPKYRTNGSHGCVHMPLAAIRFLYNWADIGTTVHIAA